MKLLEELRIAREVNREAGEAARLARQAQVLANGPTPSFSWVNIAILLPFVAAAFAVMVVIAGILGPYGEAWVQAGPHLVILGFTLVPGEYCSALWGQRIHRLGSAARTATLTWAVSWVFPILVFWLVACAACVALAQLPRYAELWPRAVVTTTIECVGLMIILLTARLAGALVAERTEPRPSA